MPNTRQILIVDDDPELRDALSEQLSLYEEFEAVAVENGSKGVQAAKAGQIVRQSFVLLFRCECTGQAECRSFFGKVRIGHGAARTRCCGKWRRVVEADPPLRTNHAPASGFTSSDVTTIGGTNDLDPDKRADHRRHRRDFILGYR